MSDEMVRRIEVAEDHFPGKVTLSAVQTSSDGRLVSSDTLRLSLVEAEAAYRALGEFLGKVVS